MAIQRDKIVASAEKLVGKGKIEPAIKEYERLLDDNPNDVNTLNRIGDLWVRVNRTDEAVKVFTRIADHYSKDGFFLKAIAIFKKINKLDPSRLEIYAKLADLYAKQGLAMEAKGQYQVLADYYLKHGDPPKALATYRKIAELDPNSINVHVKLADLYSQNGQVPEALKEYDRVGRMLLKRGMTDEAVQVFRKALKIDPANVELAESLANTLIEAKDYEHAQQILQGAHEGAPDNPRITALLGKVHIARGDLRGAEALLTEAVAQHPGEISVADPLAELHLRRGRADEALDILRPLVTSAVSRGERGGVEMLQRILKVDSTHIPTLETLVGVYEKLKEETNILSSMNSLAEAHISAGNHEEAAEILDRLIKREPENAQHREKLSFVRSHQPGGAPAPEAYEPPPPAAAPPAEEDFATGGDEPALSLDEDDSVDLSLGETPVLPPLQLDEPDEIPELTESEAEDLDFITEQLTEAEVFAKYGLTEKAVEHLQAVLERSPRNLTAFDKLLHIHMDEGNAGEVQTVAGRYLEILEERGETDIIEAVREQLQSRGFSAAGEPVVEEPEISPATSEEPEIEFDIEEPEPAKSEVEIPDLSLSESEEASAELETAAPEEEIAFGIDDAESELGTSLTAEEEEPADLETLGEEDVLPEELAPEEVIEELTPEAEEDLLTAAEAAEEETADTFDEVAMESLPVEEELAAPPEPAPAMGSPAAEELGEIDFYVEQDLFDEAEERIAGLEERYPGNAQLATRREQLEARKVEGAKSEGGDILGELRDEVEEEITAPVPAAADEGNLFDEEDDFFDLAAELEQELADDGEPLTISEEEQSLEEIFKEFKKGVEQQLDAEDYDTHYNLGIAYKEMGLIDEAIGEFQLASKDPRRMIECCSMLGLCFLEKGMPQLAIKWYQKGLEAPEISEDENLGLLYDLGSAFLEVGDTAAAQKAFLEVYGAKSNYRDIVSRIKQLENVAKQ
ncbi:MAG TPA: tetratricopeptide repeat protein [Thermoanaerobaculia bacterium]|nr:tetratricopeptide repeat protein [Thermoanaerobaculia bacterium]